MTTAEVSLTDRQREVLEYIVQYLSANDCQPSYREIGEALGIGNVNGVVCHIRALEDKGYVRKRQKHRARSLDIDWDLYSKFSKRRSS